MYCEIGLSTSVAPAAPPPRPPGQQTDPPPTRRSHAGERLVESLVAAEEEGSGHAVEMGLHRFGPVEAADRALCGLREGLGLLVPDERLHLLAAVDKGTNHRASRIPRGTCNQNHL